jgi:hypothetical protein
MGGRGSGSSLGGGASLRNLKAQEKKSLMHKLTN